MRLDLMVLVDATVKQPSSGMQLPINANTIALQSHSATEFSKQVHKLTVDAF